MVNSIAEIAVDQDSRWTTDLPYVHDNPFYHMLS